MNERYVRQLALPEMTQAHQDFLRGVKILMVGTGGLGAPALPYLAGAGVGHIAIADHDTVHISNLHRQTIFKTNEAGQGKAALAADYLRALNPEISVVAIAEKITAQNAEKICSGFDLILDGSDNFETKFLLNDISIQLKTPLLSASVEQFNGMAGLFAGFADAPCYRCLHPEMPQDACNCEEGGILGTVAGLAGMYQAHMALSFLLGLGDVAPGSVLSMDFRSMRTQMLRLAKDPECSCCSKNYGAKKVMPVQPPSIPLVHPDDLRDHLIVDVRRDDEVETDPIGGALHMRLDTIPERYRELPQDKLLAFACSSNIRSRRAAEYLYGLGYRNVCVMDRLAS